MFSLVPDFQLYKNFFRFFDLTVLCRIRVFSSKNLKKLASSGILFLISFISKDFFIYGSSLWNRMRIIKASESSFDSNSSNFNESELHFVLSINCIKSLGESSTLDIFNNLTIWQSITALLFSHLSCKEWQEIYEYLVLIQVFWRHPLK